MYRISSASAPPDQEDKQSRYDEGVTSSFEYFSQFISPDSVSVHQRD
jgi:hypothetical protein